MADAPQIAHSGPWPQTVQSHDQHSALSPDRKWQDTLQATDHRSPTNILGLRRRNFWILCIIAIVLIGGIVGGSVGGVAAVRAKSDDTSFPVQTSGSNSTQVGSRTESLAPSASPSAASGTSSLVPGIYIPFQPSSVPNIDTSCPSGGLTAWSRDGTGDRYNCSRETDINLVGDLLGIVAYTPQACIDACSSMNRVAGSRTCVAVAIVDTLAKEYGKQGANCFLKNKSGPPKYKEGVMLAVLQ